MTKDDEYYVGTCTHVNENNVEYEESALRRISWLKSMEKLGLRTKVALINDVHAGFIYVMPVEINPWSIQGKELMVFPCVVSQSRFSSKGVGKQLIKAAEDEALKQQRKGIATIGHFWDFWFMPAKYFEKLGYKVAVKRGVEAILWKQFETSAESPQFREINYEYQPVKGKVVVDLFWNTFCQTSDVEAQRVRDIILEYKDEVVLNEYSADNQSNLQKYGLYRRIYVNGKVVEVGPEIEKEKLRQRIEQAKIKD
jgi:predicted N-acetyltransferase YhbS